ncbi:MAG: Sua5/YciO/YrdC/YwlC family protein, partial [Actinomycetes bacterium]
MIAKPSKGSIEKAAGLLRSGGLVAIPTETVYGLACDASNPEAVGRVFATKGRPADHPLIVHIAAAEQLGHWAVRVPDSA